MLYAMTGIYHARNVKGHAKLYAQENPSIFKILKIATPKFCAWGKPTFGAVALGASRGATQWLRLPTLNFISQNVVGRGYS